MDTRATRGASLTLIGALLVALAVGPVLAACDAQPSASCCCGSGPGEPSPCRDGERPAPAFCCSPATPSPAPTVAASPDQLKTADDAIDAPAVRAIANVDRPIPDRVAHRHVPPSPPSELFTLHESFLI